MKLDDNMSLTAEKTISKGESDRESSVESCRTCKSELSAAAESDIIDVNDIELSDEESWLYTSPRKVSTVSDGFKDMLKEKVSEQKDIAEPFEKNALLRKLNVLQLQGVCAKPSTETKNFSSVDESSTISAASKKSCDIDSRKGKENDILDVADVLKIAQQQEESLQKNTEKYMSIIEKNSGAKHVMLQSKLSKPASVEALNICNGIQERKNGFTAFSPVESTRRETYGSASCLYKPDAYRGSLPNISPVYYSLRKSKGRPPADPKPPYPLPPLFQRPTTSSPNRGATLLSPTRRPDAFESRTLPSSYRAHSRSSSSPRKESAPFYGSLRTASPAPVRQLQSPSSTRRGSAPGSAHASPLLFRKGDFSPAPSRRRSSAAPGRQPLSPMQNGSPKRGGPRNSLGPETNRSGIPVPSYSSRVNLDDEWSQDCF